MDLEKTRLQERPLPSPTEVRRFCSEEVQRDKDILTCCLMRLFDVIFIMATGQPLGTIVNIQKLENR